MTILGGRDWFSVKEYAASKSPELPASERSLNRLFAAFRGDASKARAIGGRGRANWQYHVSCVSTSTQARMRLLYAQGSDAGPAVQPEAESPLWKRFKALSKAQKDECARRLEALSALEALLKAGFSQPAAIINVGANRSISRATLYNWLGLVQAVPRADWLAALAPGSKGHVTFADCHPKALEALKADWLRPERPSFSSCYRRVRKAASANGWLPIPSERALRRRVENEVPAGVIALAREGKDKLKRLYPAQKRIRTHFHAMQAVNIDGHKIDVFVLFHDGRISRAHLIVLQDLYSGLIVAWRLAESENKETVRLLIGDMVERHGIPEKMWLDNGRAFASKWITGQTPNRYRFKIRDEDPRGLLTTLGVEIHWTTPYAGQSKPIERAFRDLADNIAKHPFCAGAYTGNKPEAKPENYGDRAIAFDAFRDHVAREIIDHNERAGRTTDACAGRSFLDTFKASLADPATLIRWPTQGQKQLWLLAADRVRSQRGSGEIHFYGNRYWHKALNAHAGEYVTVRFDPDRLQEPISVYSADDRLICEATCVAPVGFDDADAARVHARDRGAYLKAQREQLRLERKLSADELARLYGSGEKPAEPAPMPPKVKRIAAFAALSAQPQQITEDEFSESFSAGLRLIDDGEVIPFTPKRREHG